MLLALKNTILSIVTPVDSTSGTKTVSSRLLSRRWLGLSLGTLIISGVFSIVIVIGRAPLISELIVDPTWAKRGLVIHVNLALIVWLFAFLSVLFVLMPSSRSSNRLLPLGYLLSVSGVGLLIATLFIPGAEPVLSNYIPMLDHPLFIGGLLLFGLGIGCTFLNSRMLPPSGQLPEFRQTHTLFPASTLPGLRSAALLMLIAFLTFFGSWLFTSTTLDTHTYYELTIWGGGHLLQFVNVAAMLSIWMILYHRILGKELLNYRKSSLLFTLFVFPVLFAPLLTFKGTSDLLYHWGFTQYMQWGIFPIVTVFIVLIIVAFAKSWSRGSLPGGLLRNPSFGGLATSIVLTLIGFVLGAFIRDSNTLIPAHYHAAVGGVTVAYMAITYLLLEYHDIKLPTERIRKFASIQPLLFGFGQAVFAAGFGYAGIHGMARKSFGIEQQINSLESFIGLGLMAIGGLLAVCGGILYLWIVIRAWMNHRKNTITHKSKNYGY